MNKPRYASIAGAATLAISASVALGLPAQAASSPQASTTGTCTQSSHIRLTVTSAADKLNVKAQISGGHRGDEIVYVFADNGNKVAIGNKNTGRHGQTTIRKTIRNVQGRDTVVFTSTNTQTAETCIATVIFKR